VLAFSVARWRRDGKGPRGEADASSAPSGEDAERLDADIARYDL